MTRGNYKWLVVGMLWLVCFFNYADRQAISAVAPKLTDEFGFDKFELGLIGSAFMWVYAAGAPFAGFVGDRVRRKDLILGGCFFWSAVTGLTAWCSQLWHFITVRALEGFGETFYFPASMSLTSDYHDGRTRSRAMALHQSSVYLGTIGGSWLGAVFAEWWGWRSGFYFFGAAGMVLALLLYVYLREPAREGVAAETASAALPLGESLALILREPRVWFLMLAFLCANFVATIFLFWTPTFLYDKFGYQLSAAGLTGAVFIHLASAVSVPLAGLAADRLSQRGTGGRILVQMFGLAAGASFVAWVGWAEERWQLLTAMTCFGLCKGCYDSGIFASLYDVVDPRVRATAAGLMNTVGWGGGALGPVYVGLASMYGPHETEIANMSDAIALGGLVYVVGAGWLLLAWWKGSGVSERGANVR